MLIDRCWYVSMCRYCLTPTVLGNSIIYGMICYVNRYVLVCINVQLRPDGVGHLALQQK